MSYKPLPPGLTIQPSPIHGIGLFAQVAIETDTCLGTTHVRHSEFDSGWIRTPLGGFYNHSHAEPNCTLRDALALVTPIKELVTLRDIAPGEELLCRYTLYPFPEVEE